MVNPTRNEMIIKLAGEEILLRPTFENVCAMEENLGGLAYLNWKFTKGIAGLIKREGETALDVARRFNPKDIPPLTEVAKVIYFNQAATKESDPTLKKLSLEEVFELVMKEGATCAVQVTTYLAKVTNGDKMATKVEDLPEGQKKS